MKIILHQDMKMHPNKIVLVLKLRVKDYVVTILRAGESVGHEGLEL